jgi:ankyrin repeat protein
MAAENGYIDTVRFLQEKGANVQRVDMNGRSSLFMAAQNGHIETVRFLSDSGTDVRMSTDEDGWTPLHMASWNGHLETVRFLVEKGIDAGAVAKNGWTPLHMAVENGDVKTVRFLEGLTADVRVAGRTRIPLYRAILLLLVIFVIGAVLYIFYSG